MAFIPSPNSRMPCGFTFADDYPQSTLQGYPSRIEFTIEGRLFLLQACARYPINLLHPVIHALTDRNTAVTEERRDNCRGRSQIDAVAE